jgi:glycerol-3-phosphate dehydrogenase
MAMTLADLVFRRTNCGTRSVPDRASLEEWASIAASALGWSDADRARQVGDVIAAYARVSMWPA